MEKKSSLPGNPVFSALFLRALAVEILGRIGPAAEGAIPALERALQDPDDEARREAGEALAPIRAILLND